MLIIKLILINTFNRMYVRRETVILPVSTSLAGKSYMHYISWNIQSIILDLIYIKFINSVFDRNAISIIARWFTLFD